MKNLKAQSNPLTFETVWASIQESNRYLTEIFAESDRKFQKMVADLNQKFAETDRKWAETDKRWEQTRQENNEMNKKYWGISKSNGEVAEEYFINSFSQNPFFAQQEFDIITSNLHHRNKKLQLECEFDLVLYNGSSVAIIEIKYKARKDDIELLIEKPETFKHFYPEYRNYKFYLGLAGLTVEKSAETEAKKQGIAIIKQVGENMVVNDKDLKMF